MKFDCLPMRSRADGRADGAPPELEAQAERISATAKHGQLLLRNASCTFGLTNDDNVGMPVPFEAPRPRGGSEGPAMRSPGRAERCDWLTSRWSRGSGNGEGRRSVEFDRYIAAGDNGRSPGCKLAAGRRGTLGMGL